MKIYKYNLPGLMELPAGYTVLHIECQGDSPTVWCAVDPEAPLSPAGIIVLPTGADIPDGAQHLGSFLMMNGALVWHVFREQQ